MFNRILLSILFCSLLMPAISQAQSLSPKQVAQKLQEKYDKTKSMTADFYQITATKMSRRQKKGSGTIALLKPGRMRWDYETPDKQVIVCDGNDISMYFAKEKQFLTSSAKQYLESDVTYSFFAGTGNILRDFEVSNPENESFDSGDDSKVLRMEPKESHPQVDYIMLWTGSDFLINRLMIVDKFGSTTNIEFLNIKLNPTIKETVFNFQPPEGTEIIKQ